MLAPFLALALGAAQAAPPDLDIPYEDYRLDNGLRVLLSEDHSVPFVQVNLWYAVGSKDEEAGRKGFAHLFEHLMFQGSLHHPDDYFLPLQAIGARVNGTTNVDRTNYFEGVPSEYLPLALWLESDRMGWLLEALDEEKLQNQKDVVRNERRQNYENRPYGMTRLWLSEALYPPGHPYHVPTIGLHEDIEAATLDDVKAFFSTWYVPNNATLTICGDFDPSEARTLVERYFGPISRAADPSPVTEAPAILDRETVIRRTDAVPHAKVWLAWLSPPLYAPGDADLDILSEVLTEGKDSRLYLALVHDKQIAKDVSAWQDSNRLQSSYVIQATAAEGHTTDELVAAIDEVLEELRREGPTADEVEVARTSWQVRFYQGLQTIARKADLLGGYATMTGDPGYIDEDLGRYLAVTAESTHAALRTWLGPDRRVVLHVVPGPKATDGGNP